MILLIILKYMWKCFLIIYIIYLTLEVIIFFNRSDTWRIGHTKIFRYLARLHTSVKKEIENTCHIQLVDL